MPGGPPAGRAPAGAGLCGDGCSPAAEHLDDAYGEEEPEADDVGREAGIDERQPADEQEGAFPCGGRAQKPALHTARDADDADDGCDGGPDDFGRFADAEERGLIDEHVGHDEGHDAELEGDKARLHGLAFGDGSPREGRDAHGRGDEGQDRIVEHEHVGDELRGPGLDERGCAEGGDHDVGGSGRDAHAEHEAGQHEVDHEQEQAVPGEDGDQVDELVADAGKRKHAHDEAGAGAAGRNHQGPARGGDERFYEGFEGETGLGLEHGEQDDAQRGDVGADGKVQIATHSHLKPFSCSIRADSEQIKINFISINNFEY